MNKEKNNSNKCPICGKLSHKESKYCIFHASVEEKTEEEFIEALKEYIQEIKEEDKDYDFKEFIFIGDINFKKDLNINIFKNANFEGAFFKELIYFEGTTFEGGANFEGTFFEELIDFEKASFEESADFSEATFKKKAYFSKVTFGGSAKFNEVTFGGSAKFNEVTFEESADFNEVIFKGDADFSEATFKKKAYFSVATFGGSADFNEVTFEENADFNEVIFEGDADFKVKSFVECVIFEKVRVLPGKKLNLKVENNKVNVYFERAYLEDVYLDISLVTGVLIDFNDALLRNTKIKKDQIKNHILQEKKKEFSEAQQVYLLLKNNFHSIGKYNDESWAFKKEKDMERKSNCHFKTLHKWLWSCFLNALYGYGEKPERVIVSAIAIIIIFSFVFMNFGIDASPQLDTIPKYNILKELFMGIRYGDLLVRLKVISLEQIKNCLYFSTVTFTTLGLGDFRPVEGWSRIFVGSEAFIGAFMMALFVYTFARRTGGR